VYNNLTSRIERYVRDQSAHYAIALEGDWGSGKTRYCETELTNKLYAQGYDVLRVSLFGITNSEEVYRRLAMSMTRLAYDEDDSRAQRFIKSLVTIAAQSAISYGTQKLSEVGVSLEASPQMLTGVLGAKQLIVFDDVERCGTDAGLRQGLFGLINNLIEAQGRKVMLVTNQYDSVPADIRDTAELTRYDSFLGIIPDPDILLSPMLTAEAANSSRIEGTRATMSDVLAFEAGVTNIDPEKIDDIQEVINYRRAVILAEKMLKELPLTGRILCAAHDLLLKGVRGELKSPGRYRFDQVWIGQNYNKEDARYMPPDAKDVPDAMSRWECFVNSNKVTPLVKAAIAHAEFESIHPFADGNGRMDRIVIPLMLEMDGVISSPCFYLSEFFEHRNTEYQDRLLAVSGEDAWTEWCIFFLDAVATQAKENHSKANGIFRLYQETLDFLMTTVRTDNAAAIAPHLFRMAIFPASIFTRDAGLNQSTAKRVVRSLKEAGIIVEILPHRGSSPAVLAFPKLLKILDGIDITVGRS